MPEVQFRDSLFAAEIFVNPCETATKGTKKLLAIVSTFASREFVLVEVVIVPQTEQEGTAILTIRFKAVI